MVEKVETWKRQKQFLTQLPSAFVFLFNEEWKRMNELKPTRLETNRSVYSRDPDGC